MDSILAPAILVILTGIIYTIPNIWIKDQTPFYLGVMILTNAILMVMYSVWQHSDDRVVINMDVFYKMILSGVLIFVSWLFYLKSLKYEKYSLVAATSIIGFITSSIIAMTFLGSSVNYWKILGIMLAVLGAVLIIYGDVDE